MSNIKGKTASDLTTGTVWKKLLRFFIPISLAVCGGGIFTGTARLMERGIGIYEELFRDAGISHGPWADPENKAPGIFIRGALKAGDYTIRGDVSSQFVTGLLLALSLLDRDSTVRVLPPVERRGYIDITVDVMRQFGVLIEEPSEHCFRIPGGQTFRAQKLQVEGDWSNAAFLYALRATGQDIQIRGLNPGSMQGDRACVEDLRILKEQRQPVSIDLSDTPDLAPVLFAAAAALGGGSFTGTRRLRIKESDRAAAMQEELEKFGIVCRVGENNVVVEKGILKTPQVPLSGHNDHRVVMALSVLAMLTGAEIEDAQAVGKSWPDFFAVMQSAGMDLQYFS